MTKPWNELSDADRARLLRFIDSGGQDLGLGDLGQAAAGPDGERLRAAAEQFLRAMVRRYEGAIGREIEATVVGELLTAFARVLKLTAADEPITDRMMRVLEVNQSVLARQVSQLAADNETLQRRYFEAIGTLEDAADAAIDAKDKKLAETLHALAQRNAALIVARDPLEARTLTLPLRDPTILPGEAEDIQVLPKTLFRIERLLIADTCVGCMVEELRVGTQAILREVLPCSAAVFTQTPLPSGAADRVVSAPGRPRMTTSQVVQRARDLVAELLPKQGVVEPGIAITLRVRNLSDQPVVFRGCFFGRAVR